MNDQNAVVNLHPLFDTAKRLIESQLALDDYPSLRQYLESRPVPAFSDWQITARYLIEYASSSGTFSRFRGEIQRFLLYLWNISERSLAECTSDDINSYMQFLKDPDPSWIGGEPIHSFKSDGSGVRVSRENWRPFVSEAFVLRGEYAIRQETLNAARRTLHVFFRTLVTRNYLDRSPMVSARKADQKTSRKNFEDDNGEDTAPRLTDYQWGYLKESLLAACEEDDKYERHLFVVMTMKTLYLRVSELAPQRNELTGETYAPTMSAFRPKVIDGQRYWHLKILGKGSKERYIPLPSGYLYFVKRFRRWRALPPLPEKGEQIPMIPRQNGTGQVGKRTLERIVKEAFLLAAKRMEAEGLEDDAKEMTQIADHTHYLRHTGAGMDIDAGRPIRHVSEDLGHDSVAFTESIYIHADASDRYRSGLTRKV
ncbi:tyrosine-type recombinase/integrase [Marinobacter sp. F3R08]|uniref:tyrosine-type recombinase/integrase n=1 Tax=Marinobacter sp. F3R08 TaxID=2841559 RepID=UPI001C093775|nr:site-specific integrase [Marinobacter sp. F3R08]MBU2952303.1 site-specific integrase [Marinobacter sp. F3R08]